MVIDVGEVAKVGIGSRALDRSFEILEVSNAQEWLRDLLALIQDQNEMIAFGASSILESCVHAIGATLNGEYAAGGLDIPSEFQLEVSSTEEEIENYDRLGDKDRMVYDCLHQNETNRDFFQTITERLKTAEYIGFRASLVDLLSDAISFMQVEQSYIASFRQEVIAMLEDPGLQHQTAHLEFIIEFIDLDLAEAAED